MDALKQKSGDWDREITDKLDIKDYMQRPKTTT